MIKYHLGKTNVVTDVLSTKCMSELRPMFTQLSVTNDGGFLVELQVRPTLSQQIKVKQACDEELAKRVRQVEEGM